MESLKDISNMCDASLKPKLLRLLLKDFVPHEKHAFSFFSGMPYIVSTVKTHKLLYECASVEKELIVDWMEAVDSWVRRVLAVASSDSQESCWAGLTLLGITSQECSSKRFLDSYSSWFDKLISHMLQTGPRLVKVATCAALSDLFTRLSKFQNEKKDGTSLATRIIEPILKMFNDESSFAEEALHLLCILMKFFPVSIHRHYDTVEAAIVSKMFSGKCDGVLKKLSYSLSLLPKSRGDEDGFLMMERILLSIDNQLNDFLEGLEEDARSNGAILLSIHSGKESRRPLGGLEVRELTTDLSTRPERLLGSRISALMSCCIMMLTSSYPVEALVPVWDIIALAGRVLMVDGSLSQSSLSCMSTLKQEFICSELPLLQFQSFEILTALIKGLTSQASRYAPKMVRLVEDYLRRRTFPELRARAYKMLTVLLMSEGVGIAIHLSQVVINNALTDLDISGFKDDTSHKTSTDVLLGPRRKRRRHSHVTGSVPEQATRDTLDVEMPLTSSPISLKVAALEALETLLIVGGGSWKSESWRRSVDDLIITVATKALKGGWCPEETNSSIFGVPNLVSADLKLAALHTLLASLLAPGYARPEHMALGLELFRAGSQDRETAEFCGYALFALETLNHPRTLPLLDFHSSSDDYKPPSHKFSDSIAEKNRCEPESEDDDLRENWLDDDSDEMEIQIPGMPQNAHDREEPSVTVKNPVPDSLPSGKGTFTMAREGSEPGVSAGIPTTKVVVHGDKFTDESPENGANQASDWVPNATDSVKPGGDKMASADEEVAGVHETSHGLPSDQETTAPTDVDYQSEAKNDGISPIVERISATLSWSTAGKGSMFESGNESWMDSIPDIVDGDPDSD